MNESNKISICLSNFFQKLFISLSLWQQKYKKSVNRRFLIGGHTLVYLCVGETSLVRSFIFGKKLASVKR